MERLDVTTPETFPSITDWQVTSIHMDREAPAIIVTCTANTGEQRTWRLIPTKGGVTEAQVRQALSFVNRGQFATVDGKSLNRWLLEQWAANGGPAGAVAGVPE